ncbi:hypothetical protein GG804_25220 [Sphingomonas histidinilytica]|uniref:Uncharacterized protein n=1 Tax=Rhizorhabdus histidinilytica TaxID=439228 RepID=A0A1T5A8Z4_9SPHN|nr:hypothetical protein [Rhizorhabdus histidinilytica]MBO9380074.1 hypothetical protein [Rhizorhabdus histidinilytica]SKB31319.1 hypothetical protein SAMN06295920_101709 [Rhizorhabdus histidinilytica]
MKFDFDTSRKSHAQGDVYLIPIVAIPAEALAQPVEAEAGKLIVTHSETGHHHIVMERPDVKMFRGMDMFRDFLLIENNPATLEHLRDHHTHAPQEIQPGAYLIQRQRQPSPEGWQRASD